MKENSSNVDREALGKKNKNKGNVAERYYRDEFRNIGHDKCITSRLGSRLHDNAGLDLVLLPYNVQIKAGEQKSLKPRDELIYMDRRMKELFPSSSIEFNYPKLVIHRRYAEGTRRSEFDEIVTMSFSDFKKMAKHIYELEQKVEQLTNNK